MEKPRELRDIHGFEIIEGFYSDGYFGLNYYHIKKTPEGFMKKESREKDYSPLDNFTSLGLIRLPSSSDLIDLMLSVEKERLAQSQAKCTEMTGEEKIRYALNQSNIS